MRQGENDEAEFVQRRRMENQSKKKLEETKKKQLQLQLQPQQLLPVLLQPLPK